MTKYDRSSGKWLLPHTFVNVFASHKSWEHNYWET